MVSSSNFKVLILSNKDLGLSTRAWGYQGLGAANNGFCNAYNQYLEGLKI